MSENYFKRYLDQPSFLPLDIKKEVLNKYGDILIYGLSDINSKFLNSKKWVVITKKYILTFEGEKEEVFFLSSDLKVTEKNGAVVNIFSLKSNDEVFLNIWFSQRQNIVFAQIKYVLEELAKGNNVVLTRNCDELYFENTLSPIKKVQSGNKTTKDKVVLRLVKYLYPYRRELFLGALGATLATLVSLLPAYFSGQLVDEVITPVQEGKLASKDGLKIAWLFVLGLSISYGLKEIFMWIRLKKMSILGEKVARDLRSELYSHLQKMDMEFFSTKQTGSIISRVSSDTDRIWDFIAFGIVEVSIAIITLIALSGVLISLDPWLGMLMTLPVPLFIYAIFKHGEQMQQLFLKCWRKWSDLTSALSDGITGIQVVKSFNQEDREIGKFNTKNNATVIEFNNVHKAWTSFWPKLMGGIHIIMISVWILAIPRLTGNANDPNFLSAGTFVSFLLYMTMFSGPIEIIGQMARMLNRATSSAFRIFEILDTKANVEGENGAVQKEIKGEIEFKNVIFSYDGVRKVLKGLNLKIKAGTMVGLVGPSGSGKSTITKLMNRFYDVSSGSILVDGVDLKDFEIGALRSQIGFVHQDPYLFHGSILENIRYGNEKATLMDVIEAAKIANAHEFILGFKDGYDTIVGERGKTLSGGERQRVSIARAIINDPKILILDEATSAVDTETERKIQDALDKLIEGRTVIAIAHRLSTLRRANEILVIKNGELVEQGSHETLMGLSGEYYKLQKMQLEMHNLMLGTQTSTEVLI